ncbi:hypothetical protein BaRGS_00012766 [Batillaria attramentaria]|uniref:Uncharacterized protein n=1 Tax=Batillaria attramentaria TaxID=370345 RepID=A0ABD0L9R9_9CAEN
MRHRESPVYDFRVLVLWLDPPVRKRQTVCRVTLTLGVRGSGSVQTLHNPERIGAGTLPVLCIVNIRHVDLDTAAV